MKDMKKKNAFTLGEVLTTLAIIGVIAVLGMTVLNKVKPDQNAIKYKQTFYAIQQAASYLINDWNKYPDATQGFLAPSDAIKYTDPVNKTGLKNNRRVLCEQIAEQLNTIGAINCNRNSNLSNANMTTSTNNFQLQNGAVVGGLSHKTTDLTASTLTICIDVNGLNKGPNKGCKTSDANAEKRDQYKMIIHSSGKVSTNWAVENAFFDETGVPIKK